MPDLLCLGEPLIELNAQTNGAYLAGFGGDVSNVAIAAARQGTDAGLVTHVGQDVFGDHLLALWQREGVNTTHIKSMRAQDTGLYFVHHDDAGHHFTYRRKGSACSLMSKADIDDAAIARAEIFYTSGISLAVSTTLREATQHAIAVASQNGVTVAIDPNLREKLWSLDEARSITHDAMRHIDIALPGLEDARRLTGLQSPDQIVRFYHDLGVRVVALTLGADGVAVSDGDGLSIIPGHPVEAVDATGAGDCFNGIFLSLVLRGRPVADAAQNANIGAALSTTGYGAIAPIPFPDDIDNAHPNARRGSSLNLNSKIGEIK